MKKHRLLALASATMSVAIAASLIGCASGGNYVVVQEVRQTTRGPIPKAYEDKIKAHLDGSLRDPDSMKLRNMSTPTPVEDKTQRVLSSANVFFGTQGQLAVEIHEVWLVKVEVNAKNAYGGYTGYEQYEFRFRGDELVQATNITEQRREAEEAFQKIMNRK